MTTAVILGIAILERSRLKVMVAFRELQRRESKKTKHCYSLDSNPLRRICGRIVWMRCKFGADRSVHSLEQYHSLRTEQMESTIHHMSAYHPVASNYNTKHPPAYIPLGPRNHLTIQRPQHGSLLRNCGCSRRRAAARLQVPGCACVRAYVRGIRDGRSHEGDHVSEIGIVGYLRCGALV